MGGLDRSIRIILSILFVYLYWAGIITGITGIILIVIAGIFFLTSVVNFCPIYSFLGINSCATKKTKQD